MTNLGDGDTGLKNETVVVPSIVLTSFSQSTSRHKTSSPRSDEIGPLVFTVTMNIGASGCGLEDDLAALPLISTGTECFTLPSFIIF